MDNLGLIGMASIISAGLTMAIGAIGPALGQGRAVAQALSAIAQQPDEANSISRTLFIGLAMVESTGIYCFVIAIILLSVSQEHYYNWEREKYEETVIAVL
jgi:F-type H+-transporting ATPase subunit c